MCNCIAMIDAHLVDKNTRVNRTIAVEDGQLKVYGVQIETVKLDTSKQGKPVSLTAAFCPFCGTKYDESED